jgi:hypothetical protein
MIKADFDFNRVLAVNKNNTQHNEIKAKLKQAEKTGALHLT